MAKSETHPGVVFNPQRECTLYATHSPSELDDVVAQTDDGDLQVIVSVRHTVSKSPFRDADMAYEELLLITPTGVVGWTTRMASGERLANGKSL